MYMTLQLCLAHRGNLDELMWMSATYKSPSKTWSGGVHFKNPLVSHEDKWTYSCIDLMEVSLRHRELS